MSDQFSRKLVLLLATCTTVIIGVHLATLVAAYGFGHDSVFGIRELFDVDHERNVPAVFSVGLLLIAAALLAVIASRQRPGQAPRAALWVGLSAVFFYLAADEGLALHEAVAKLTARMFGVRELVYYAWVVPYALFALIFVLIYARFLGQLTRDIRIQFLIAGTIYVAGALGTEVLAGVYVHFQHTEKTFAYDLLSALEESLEMAGVIWFIHALGHYLEKNSAPMQEHRSAVPQRDSSAATST